MDKIIVKIEKYNQKGEGVAFHNSIPIYIFGTIVNELVEIIILLKEKTYWIGKLSKIIEPSTNRSNLVIDNARDIGGYELVHMNDEEQKNFKINRVINDYKQIAKFDLNNVEYFQGKKRYKYRNKITIHDGSFYEKKTNKAIDIDNYLLSDIEWDKNLKGNIIYRKLDTLIWGTKKENKYTTDTMLGYKFRVSLNSFYQVNKEVATQVFEDIKENVINNGTTLDLFSGIGVIGIICSDKSNLVIGVENNKNSFIDGKFNIESNNIKNMKFFKADVHQFIDKLNQKIDTLILDPSRSGVGEKTTKKIIDVVKPQKIIYLSCNPATQANDFKFMKDKYELSKIKIYDMFPQTYHIETLIVLDLKTKN